jgi:hypothetical protein
MSKEAVFTMKLEPELRNDFMAEAQVAHRPASQFVQRQRQARDYDSFLAQKVEVARGSMAAGRGQANDEVEAAFAARRAAVASQA